MRFQGFIGPSYQLRSVNVDCQRCINLFPEVDELGTGKEKEIASLVGTPGLKPLFTAPNGPTRGVYTSSKEQLFAVAKNKLYLVNSTWNMTELGTLNTFTGPTSMVDDGFNLVLVDGPNGYNYNFATSTFTVITDSNFLGADVVTLQDTYFIFNQPGTTNFFISALPTNDPTVAVAFAGDVGVKTGNSDNIVTVLSDHRNLWLFGSQCAEVWYDSADNNFPFQRIEGAYVEHGCAAPFSAVKMNGTIYWLGKDDKGQGMVFQAAGYQPQRISTYAVELAIQSYGDISDAVAYTYQDNGHHFYVLNFSNANTTWVFDASTSLWHERAYTNLGQLERHRANHHAFAYGKHVVGDYATGAFYQLSNDVFSDNGREIIRRRVAPHLSQDMMRIFYASFQLDIETGTGIDGLGQGVDPQVMLQFSDDGGHSWSNEKWTSFGKIGHMKKRALWRRLGQSRDRVFRISISDPVKVVLIGAEINITAGTN